MARYRLRFLLQEFDLPYGVTLIGRSVECHLTIEDALVSRHHARLIVSDEGVQIEDLGSRNGVRVNGTPVKRSTELKSGDRVRLGVQELLFTRVDDNGRVHARTTGQLRLCAKCRQPYPREMVACPNCEATEQTDEETITGSGSENAHAWTVQLFVEAIGRALRLGRVADAGSLLRRAALQIDELVAGGGSVDEEALAALAIEATRTALATEEPTWAVWALEAYGRSRTIPPRVVVERMRDVAAKYARPVQAAVAELLLRLSPFVATSKRDVEALTLLQALQGGHDEEHACQAGDGREGRSTGPGTSIARAGTGSHRPVS